MAVKKLALALIAAALSGSVACPANADGPVPAAPPPDPLTTIVCRDREDPSVGATLVFDLARNLLVSSSNVGDTILFGDRNVRVHINPAAIEWEVAYNTYTLNRATLELDVIGRVYFCRLAQRLL
jgi:hypothetical protein